MADGPRRGLLTLISGDTIQGVVRKGDSADAIGWQGIHFVDPFQFRLGTVRSIKFPSMRLDGNQGGPFSFELTTGDVIFGKLVGLTDQAVQIGSDDIGVVSIRRDLLRRIHRIDENTSVTFSSLRGMEGWRNLSLAGGGWFEDGDQIGTNLPGTAVSGEHAVPPRAVVDLELSWAGTPDFVFAIASDTAADDDAKQEGWRLETAGNDLVMVREEAGRVDVDTVADLSRASRIRLIIYLDQLRKTMEALRGDGISIGRISLSAASSGQPESPGSEGDMDADTSTNRGIRILNRGESLRLERLQIARWVGGIPSGDSTGEASIALADGSVVSGRVTGFDSTTNRLELKGTSKNLSLDLANVVTVRLDPKVGSVDPGQCALFLHGGMRLSGQLIRVGGNGWVLGGDHYQQEVQLPHKLVRTLIVFESEAANLPSKPVLGRIGRLEIGSDRSSGRLVSDDASADGADAFPWRWHPLSSNTSARIRRDAMGKIVYRDPPKIDSQSAAARMLAQQRLRTQQQRRGLNFGELFLQRADLTKESPVKRDAHVVHLRSGDVIACRVDSIDESGVSLSTANSEGGFVPHERIKAIEFVANSPPPSIDDAKRERLLTIPRLQKTAPPSHLLCSHNGDFLRCRLLATEKTAFRIEVQMEELLVPRERVAQIIWFHRSEIESADSSVSEAVPVDQQDREEVGYAGLMQVVLNDGKRVTFTPTRFVDGVIEGTSQWVGACRFDLTNVDQIVLGDQIAEEVADVAYNQWKLQPAVEPLVTAAMSGDAAKTSGTQSPLVGIEAPEIKLELLNGETFQLSRCKGQIVVLDFWASWCAPCMQTMPLISDAMAEFDPSQVRLVSVNLGEPVNQIEEVLERQQMQTTVALDRDGAVAQQYQARAIPQLVIVNADGNVERLYVGGGSEVVERMQADIRALLDTADAVSP